MKPVFHRIQLMRHEIQEATDKICYHDSYNDESDDIVDVENEILLNNRLIITIFALERFEKFTEPRDVQQLDETWKPRKTK